ncbi:hypothetical protein JW872_01190 [Candidatus Babeliales bacterium]|nr:hypothetical protein [Candidatus Babeliales bacterium]
MSMQRMVAFLLCLMIARPVLAELTISEPNQTAPAGESFQLKDTSLPQNFTIQRGMTMQKARVLGRFSPYVAAAAVVMYIVGAKAFIMAPPWSIVILIGLTADYIFETLIFSNKFSSKLAPFALVSMLMKQNKQFGKHVAQFLPLPNDAEEGVSVEAVN